MRLKFRVTVAEFLMLHVLRTPIQANRGVQSPPHQRNHKGGAGMGEGGKAYHKYNMYGGIYIHI